jgi:hypothetical protein
MGLPPRNSLKLRGAMTRRLELYYDHANGEQATVGYKRSQQGVERRDNLEERAR